MDRNARSAWGLYCLVILVVTAIFFSACTSIGGDGKKAPEISGPAAWKNIPLENVMTGEEFLVDDFSSAYVLLFTFTTSCPVCVRQQEEIMSLQEVSSSQIVPVGLNIEPNGDPDMLRSYLQQNGFEGYYALSPPELTRAILNDFGLELISPATAPVILICPGGEGKKLRPGLKPATEIVDAISKEC